MNKETRKVMRLIKNKAWEIESSILYLFELMSCNSTHLWVGFSYDSTKSNHGLIVCSEQVWAHVAHELGLGIWQRSSMHVHIYTNTSLRNLRIHYLLSEVLSTPLVPIIQVPLFHSLVPLSTSFTRSFLFIFLKLVLLTCYGLWVVLIHSFTPRLRLR